MSALQQRGHEIIWHGSSRDELPIGRLHNCDLVHVYRAADARLLTSLEYLRRGGVAVSWDNDDDVMTLPKGGRNHRQPGALEGQRDFAHQARAMNLADLVTTTSQALVRRFSEAGARHVELIENYLPSEFVGGRRKKHNGLVIGWAGLHEHETDVKLLNLASIFRQILTAHAGARLVTVGLGVDLTHDRYEHRSRVPFELLGETIREFDIGIAPLADMPFNRARSNVKLKEYAVAGVPWLASRVGEYRHLGPKQGGRLVADDAWYEALNRLLHSGRDRTILGSRGKMWARRQTIDFHVVRWERAFKTALARSRAEAPRS